ncbi:MAG: hypothetical protein CL527_06560 [Aequorivita sp.]|nr:hypothetical protein [Aequorivita sp.]
MGILKSHRLSLREKGLKRIELIKKNGSETLLIHYSCESFLNSNGRTPRIVSISVMDLETSQTNTYSIHLQAQFLKYDFHNLTEIEFDECEKKMLSEYYSFLEKNKTKYFVHWSMNNSNYGFKAIDNRYRILGGYVNEIENKFKINLGETLSLIYSDSYSKDGSGGKLHNLSILNNFKPREFLMGSEEADCFENKEWLKLHYSTLSKVKLFKLIIDKTANKKLKVNSSIREIYGLSLSSFNEMINNNVALKIVWWLFLVVIGIMIKELYTEIKNVW